MIKSIRARIIPDSRKRPTVEVELRTEKGVFVASCPSGASTGKKEAKTVEAKKAVENVNRIINKKLAGLDETKQEQIDDILIKNEKLGANAILPVSIAVCRAGATSENLPLYKYISNIFAPIGAKILQMPRPCFNIINGGAHADNDLEIQEFMIVPNYSSFAKNLKIAKNVLNNLKKLLEKDFGKRGIIMGDEGGFAPPIFNDRDSLKYLSKAIGGLKVDIGLDCAATEFYNNGKYRIDNKNFNRKELLDFYKGLINNYDIIFIEDPFSETDDRGFSSAVNNLKVTIVGDDYLTTNIERIKRAKNNCTGAIIKPNQIGTMTQTLEAVRLAKSYGWKTIVSHRSGETMDDFIADLAVGINSEFIKSGAPSKPERLAKYNRLVKIEKEL
jgi:enolase